MSRPAAYLILAIVFAIGFGLALVVGWPVSAPFVWTP